MRIEEAITHQYTSKRNRKQRAGTVSEVKEARTPREHNLEAILPRGHLQAIGQGKFPCMPCSYPQAIDGPKSFHLTDDEELEKFEIKANVNCGENLKEIARGDENGTGDWSEEVEDESVGSPVDPLTSLVDEEKMIKMADKMKMIFGRARRREERRRRGVRLNPRVRADKARTVAVFRILRSGHCGHYFVLVTHATGQGR